MTSLGRPTVSVVLPCHNRAKLVRKVLTGFEKQETSFPFEVIAVDDGSTDETYEVLKGWRSSRFSLLVERQPQSGPAAARNRALEMAGGKLCLFVGDDIVPTPRFVTKHVETHEVLNDERSAVLGLTVWPREQPITTTMRHIDGVGGEQFRYHYLKEGTLLDFRYFYTSNVSIHRSRLDVLDTWFEPRLRDAAFEDVELAYRLFGKERRIYFSPEPLAEHHHFYTVQTFSDRQYRCGKAAAMVMELRPELGDWLGMKAVRQLRRQNLWGLRSGLGWKPFWSAIEDVESSVQRLVSFYEYEAAAPLQDVLRSLFLYFRLKGMVERTLKEPQASSLLGFMMTSQVLTCVQRFLEKASREQLSLPPKEDESLWVYLDARR